MDFLHSLRVFVRVVESGSFSRAAEQLSTSTAAVTRQVAALEKHLDVRLLNRTTRRLSLTSAGEPFFHKARHLLEEVEDAENIARPNPQVVSGTLRVAAPLSFGVAHLAPLLWGFRQRCPHLKLDVDLSDRVMDMAADGFDIALRIAREPHPNMVSRRISAVPLVLCAAPAYLRSRGVPRHPEELSRHESLSYTYLSWGETWPFVDAAGQVTNVRIAPWISLTNGEVLRDLAVAGAGIILQPAFIVQRELASATLIPVLPEWRPPELSLYAVYLSHRQLSSKVRLFVEYLVDAYRNQSSPEAVAPDKTIAGGAAA